MAAPIERPKKTSGARTFVDERNNGYPIIEAAEVDAELDNLVGVLNTGALPVLPPLPDLSITANQLASGAVTEPKLATGAVSTRALGDGQVTTAKLANGAVTTEKITSVMWAQVTGAPAALPPAGPAGGDLVGSIYPDPIVADGAITRAKIAPSVPIPPDASVAQSGLFLGVGADATIAWRPIPPQLVANAAVTEPKLATGAVSTRALGDAQVTAAKLQPGVIPAQLPPVNGSVTEASMADNAIDNGALQAECVTLDKINQDSVPLPPWPTHGNLGMILGVIEAGLPTRPTIAWVDPATYLPGGGGGGGGGGFWAEDIDNEFLKPVSFFARGILLASGRQLQFGDPVTGAPGRLTGIRADDNSLRLFTGSQGLFIFNHDQSAGLAWLDAVSGNLFIGPNAVTGSAGERLDVEGGIRLSNAVGTQDGTLQYTGTKFQGRVAGAWVDIPGSGGGGSADWTDSAGTATLTTINARTLALHPSVDPSIFLNAGSGGIGGLRASLACTGTDAMVSLNDRSLPTADLGSAAWQLRIGFSLDAFQVLRDAGAGWADLFMVDQLGHIHFPGVMYIGDGGIVEFTGPGGQYRGWDGAMQIPFGIPRGGTTGQVLAKSSATDFEAVWQLVTAAQLAADAKPWTDDPTTKYLKPTTTDRGIAVAQGGAQGRSPIQWGNRTIKGRLLADGTADSLGVSINASLNSNDTFYTVDDATRPSWVVWQRANAGGGVNDVVSWMHGVAGSSPTSELMQLNGAGKLTVPGGSPGDAFQCGLRVPKGRVNAAAGADAVQFTMNRRYDGVRDDATKPSWSVLLGVDTDNVIIEHADAAGTFRQPLVLDGAGKLTLSGATVSDKNFLIFGNPTIKGRLVHPNTADSGVVVTYNSALNPAGSAWIPDDAMKASWHLTVGAADQGYIFRNPPGGGAGVILWSITSLGDMVIAGSVATKASGTTWSNPSDERMKRNVADYSTGLAAIAQLRPVSFEYNGQFGSVDDGKTCYGFIAQEVEPVMPDCVSERPWAPAVAEPSAPKVEPVLVKTMDQSNIILALVNAVRELSERVQALEAA
jgi:hypothetical protein